MKEEDTIDTSQWQKLVLDAIKKVRTQKQRPSLERITNAIRQQHKASDELIKNRLDDLVNRGLILKVINKGKLSYKDPGAAHTRFLIVSKESDLSKVVVKAVRDLDSGDGCLLKNIEKYVHQSNCLNIKPGVELIQVVKSSLKRSVERGLLIIDGKSYKCIENECLSKTPKTPVPKKTPKSELSTPQNNTTLPSSPIKPGRKKKSSQLEETPKKSALPICSECLGTASKNKTGNGEELSECKECGASIHPTCAAKGDLFSSLINRGNIWHCEDCAVCVKCHQTTDKICILKCGYCNRGYHLDCMTPSAEKKSKILWKCSFCLDGKNAVDNASSPMSSPIFNITPTSPPKSRQKNLRAQQLRSLRKAARAVGKKGPGRSLSVESSSEDGNDHLPNPTPSYPPSFHPSSGGRRIETSDTISKEKQKFFRCSAFYKRYTNSPRANARDTETVPKINAITPVTPLTQFPRHVPPLNPHSENKMPFGSFCDSDEPWGFAAVKFESVKGLTDGLSHVFSPREVRGRRWKKDSPVQSPSSLVKTAVNFKALELERRKLIGEGCKLMTSYHRQPTVEWNRERQGEAATITSIMSSDLPPGVSQKDLDTFKFARENAIKLTKPNSVGIEQDLVGSNNSTVNPVKCPASIEFGKYHIHTWYSSPFPQEYARLGKLFLCEFCLKYTKSKAVLKRHLHKCTWRHPPGTEIYRHKNLSVFEVDGNIAKFYCQNLCLLAKLFLDHKTLYYDVEPFLFYVLTKNDEQGFHLVGYFSKEKHCLQKYNVSCIMTLPQYQRQGFGRFLIDFSYLLSKEEGQAGTPEKPLSDLGRVSYHAYWRSVILEYIYEHRDEDFSIDCLSKETGVNAQDIAEMLQTMGMVRPVKVDPGEDDLRIAVVVDWSIVDNHADRLKRSKTRIKIEPECLRWTPLIPTLVNPFKIAADEDGDDEDEDDDDEMEDSKIEVDYDEDIKPVLSPKPSTSKDDAVKSPGRGRAKQGLLPDLFRKQQDKIINLKAPKLKPEVPFDGPLLSEKRRRLKKKYTEVDEEDDDEDVKENTTPTVSFSIEKKRRKISNEPSPLIKPSRLKLPETPISTPISDFNSEQESLGRGARRPRMSLKSLKNESEKEEKTPELTKRQIAARARWAKHKQKEESSKQIMSRKISKSPSPTNWTNSPKSVKSSLNKNENEDVSDDSPKSIKLLKEVPVKNKKAVDNENEMTVKPLVAESPQKKRRGWVKGVSRKDYIPKPKKKVYKWGVKPRKGRAKRSFNSKPPKLEPEDVANEAQSSEVDDGAQPESPPRQGPPSVTSASSEEDEKTEKENVPEDENKGESEKEEPETRDILAKEDILNKEDNDESKGNSELSKPSSCPEDEFKLEELSLPPPDLPPAIEVNNEVEEKLDIVEENLEIKSEMKMEPVEEEKEVSNSPKEINSHTVLNEEEINRDEQEDGDKKRNPTPPPVLQAYPLLQVQVSPQPKVPFPSPSQMQQSQMQQLPPPQQHLHAPMLQPVVPIPPALAPITESVEEKPRESPKPHPITEFHDISKPPVLERVELNLIPVQVNKVPPELHHINLEVKKSIPDIKEKPPFEVSNELKKPLNLPLPPMEVDLTQCDDSRSPAKAPMMEEQPPPELTKEKCSSHIEKKPPPPMTRPYEQKLPMERYPSPMKEKKEKKITPIVVHDDDHIKQREPRMEEVTQVKPPKVPVPTYNPEPLPNPVHPLHAYSGCGELDVNLGLESQPPPNEMVDQRQLQYSDCAQQSLALHHHHLAPPSHMNMVYQQQRSSKQSVASRSSVSTTQRQVHHPSSSPAHYHQSNYIMPQGSAAYVSMLGHRMQTPTQRIGPSASCSVSSPNFYLQTTQQNSPSSLAKLQQLTNGLESIPGHCGTMTPPPRVDLTPPPSHATPPPNHYKFYPTNQRHPNMTTTPQPRGPPPHNMLQYNTFNGGYSRQQSPTVTGYITNSAGFINQAAQLPMQMMQSQYPQDPQQNSMYPTYGYHINSSLMQPLNSTMRR